MFARLALTACVTACLFAAHAEAAGPYGLIKVGQWRGGAYTNNNPGQFTSCVASAPYKSGILLLVTVDAAYRWSLGFAHEQWQLTPDEVFPIDLIFDGQAKVPVVAKALSHDQVVVPMPSNSALITQFRKAAMMSAVAKGRLFQFNLTGTGQLMPSLANCVATVKAKGVANAGDFTVAPAPKTAAAPPATGGSLKAEPPQPSAADIQIEAIGLASNFILKTSLRNPRVLSRAETPPELANGAAWKSDEASGFVRIIPPQPNLKGLDVTAAVIAADAKDCKGKFASARKSELIDSDVVFHGMVSCEDSDGARLANYFIVPRPKGGFVMFSVMSSMKNEQAQGITKEEQVGGFRKAAVVAVSQ
jgi:hypothetical protein